MEGFKTSTVLAALFAAWTVAGTAIAQIGGVDEKPPMSCRSESQAFGLTAVPENGKFPSIKPCVAAPSQTCSYYTYTVSPTTINIDHAVISVSATQQFVQTSSSGTATVPIALGDGDSATQFLLNAVHEYPVRLNAQPIKGGTFTITTLGASQARVGTVLFRSGTRRTEKCLIAAPGVTATDTIDVFQPIYVRQKLLVSGGKCLADLIYNEQGVLIDVQVAEDNTNPDCIPSDPNRPVLVNGEPLRNNTSPLGITFGNGTTTCYGPPVPSIPRCICTAAPCP
jgi:hypothetical protein